MTEAEQLEVDERIFKDVMEGRLPHVDQQTLNEAVVRRLLVLTDGLTKLIAWAR